MGGWVGGWSPPPLSRDPAGPTQWFAHQKNRLGPRTSANDSDFAHGPPFLRYFQNKNPKSKNKEKKEGKIKKPPPLEISDEPVPPETVFAIRWRKINNILGYRPRGPSMSSPPSKRKKRLTPRDVGLGFRGVKVLWWDRWGASFGKNRISARWVLRLKNVFETFKTLPRLGSWILGFEV